MAAQLDADTVDARVVKALSHPTRVRILNILRDRELASPVEIASELGLALGTVGYHVRRLETLGFIELAKRTQRRGAVEHHYRARAVLDPTAGDGTTGAASLPSGEGGGQAAEIAQTAQETLAAGGFDAVAARVDARIVTLDARSHAALERALPRWHAAVERIARASAARLARAKQPAVHRCTAVLMRFDVPGEIADDG